MDPWSNGFDAVKSTFETLVKADQDNDCHSLVELAPLDTQPMVPVMAPAHILVLPYELDLKRLLHACQKLVIAYPELAGRFDANRPRLAINCKGAGFPVSAYHWQDGTVSSFPGALSFSSVQVQLPCKFPAPVFVDDMDPLKTLLDPEAPLFKLRLTTLGDGGSVLGATWHHCVADGAHSCDLLVALARAYKGEELAPRNPHRTALTPEGLAKSIPGWDELKQGILASLPVAKDDPKPAGSFAEDWSQTWGDVDLLQRYWPLPPGVPKGPHALDFCFMHFARKDLTALRKSINNNDSGPKVTDNDALFGLLWCMHCMLSGDPLPNQVTGPAPALGIIASDFVSNGFPPGFVPEGYLVNTMLPLSIMLPPSESAQAEPDLQAAVADVARATRAALLKRREQGLMEFVAVTLALSSERAKMAQMNAVLDTGVVPSIVQSNWERFPYDKADFGQGSPVHSLAFYPFLTPNLVQCAPGKDNGVTVMSAMPAGGRAKLADAGFFATLAPNTEQL